MEKRLLVLFILLTLIVSSYGQVRITPVEHASMVLSYLQKVIYVDPVGEAEQYKTLPKPDLILVTHGHGDHFNPDLIRKLKNTKTVLIAPRIITEELNSGTAMNNGEQLTVDDILVEAVPMYNTSEGREHYHPRGAGNGYILTLGKERIYIAGDTEDTPEMRALTNIDRAFIPVNLPYTMSVEQAAEAVPAFKPRKVYPYHYRSSKGYSNLQLFKQLVEAKSNTEVILLEWYNIKK